MFWSFNAASWFQQGSWFALSPVCLYIEPSAHYMSGSTDDIWFKCHQCSLTCNEHLVRYKDKLETVQMEAVSTVPVLHWETCAQYDKLQSSHQNANPVLPPQFDSFVRCCIRSRHPCVRGCVRSECGLSALFASWKVHGAKRAGKRHCAMDIRLTWDSLEGILRHSFRPPRRQLEQLLKHKVFCRRRSHASSIFSLHPFVATNCSFILKAMPSLFVFHWISCVSLLTAGDICCNPTCSIRSLHTWETSARVVKFHWISCVSLLIASIHVSCTPGTLMCAFAAHMDTCHFVAFVTIISTLVCLFWLQKSGYHFVASVTIMSNLEKECSDDNNGDDICSDSIASCIFSCLCCGWIRSSLKELFQWWTNPLAVKPFKSFFLCCMHWTLIQTWTQLLGSPVPCWKAPAWHGDWSGCCQRRSFLSVASLYTFAHDREISVHGWKLTANADISVWPAS